MGKALKWIFIVLAVVVTGFTIYYAVSCTGAEACNQTARNISRVFIGIMRFFH